MKIDVLVERLLHIANVTGMRTSWITRNELVDQARRLESDTDRLFTMLSGYTDVVVDYVLIYSFGKLVDTVWLYDNDTDMEPVTLEEYDYED
jgi:hypothetical protein